LGEVGSANGNPLYITELVAALIREHAIAVVSDTAVATGSVAGERPSASLAEAISRRLGFLSRRTRNVLPMAAALGPAIDVAELAAVLHSPIADIWNAVAEARESGILAVVNSELVFRHDLIRRVLADQVPASLRSALLRRAGQILQTTNAPIERIAYYLTVGDHELDRTSVAWLVAVADKLVIRAPELAVQLLRRAVTGTEFGSAPRSVLIRLYATALLWNGGAVEAEAEVRVALSRRPENGDDVEMHWLLAQACQAQGRIGDSVAIAEKALTTMDLSVEQAARFQRMCTVHNFFLERFDAAERAGQQAVAMGESSGDLLTTGYGLTALGALRYTRGHLDDALELSTRIPSTLADGTGPDQFDPYALRALCLIELDRPTDAEDVLKQAIAHNRRIQGVYLSSNLVAKARLHLLGGRWDDALAECAASVELPNSLGYASVAHSMTALIGIHRGTFNPDTIPAPDARLGHTGYAYVHSWVDALLHETRGRPDLALKLLVDAQQRLADGLAAATLYYTFPDIARLAAEVGDTAAARSVTASADELAARQPTASRNGTALLCRGLADHNPDDLWAAAEAFRRAGRPLFEAHAHENAAVLLADVGRKADARRALAAATALYSRMGASWDVARTVSRVRPYGIRLGVRGPRNRPKTGWAALTDTERKVAALITEGCSNSGIAAQMYLSRRTIQSHVSSILAKLDLRSRHEIAADMAATG
jgi:DNA-binding NarL/FixJ family response regulator